MWIPFPEDEIKFVPPEGITEENVLDCSPFQYSTTISEENGLRCTYEGSLLKIELTNVMEPTGLFKLEVRDIQGPPSLRGTNPIDRVYTTTAIPAEEISEWTEVV